MIVKRNIDLSAPVILNLTLRGASGGVLQITLTSGGVAVNLLGATIKYEAATDTAVTKTVGSGITITDGANGIFQITFEEADTALQNYKQIVEHECKAQPLGGVALPVFEGKLILEESVFTTMV